MNTALDRAPHGGAHSPGPAGLIDSARHPVAARVSDILRSRSTRPRFFVIDDGDSLREAIRRGVRIDSLYATPAAAIACDALAAEFPEATPRFEVSEDVARVLFGAEKRARLFAVAERPHLAGLDALAGRSGDILVLDGVRLVGNIGAITRSACALGAAGIVLVDSGLASVLDRRLVRASRGLVFALPVVLSSRAESQKWLAQQGIPAAGMTADGRRALREIRSEPGRLAVVMGGEKHGISEEWERAMGRTYAIGMREGVGSLNVSVAAALVLYERWAAGGGPMHHA